MTILRLWCSRCYHLAPDAICQHVGQKLKTHLSQVSLSPSVGFLNLCGILCCVYSLLITVCLVISADCTTNCLQVEVKIKVELHDSGSFTKNFPSVPQENWAWVSSFHCFLFLGLPRILPCNSWYWAKYTVHTPTVALLCLQSSQDFSTYEIWKMSGELREDIIWSCPFSQVAHNMYFM